MKGRGVLYWSVINGDNKRAENFLKMSKVETMTIEALLVELRWSILWQSWKSGQQARLKYVQKSVVMGFCRTNHTGEACTQAPKIYFQQQSYENRDSATNSQHSS